MKRQRVCIMAALVALLASCATEPPTSERDETRRGTAAGVVWPTEAWPTSTPEAEGIDPEALSEVDAALREGEYGYVDALLVIRNGRLVADYRYAQDYAAASAGHDLTPHQYNYYHPNWHPFFQGSALHTMQSVTKSWTSALIGVAIERGEISGVDVPALSFFGERTIADPDGRKAEMSLEDLLTMRAGFSWDEWSVPYTDEGNDCAQLEASEDWLQFVLDKPLAADPGEVFVYNSGVSTLLSGIVLAATGTTIDLYAERHLFAPLGIDEMYWKKTPLGLPDTEGGLYLEPEDLAKLGYLFLHDGVWEGERILPEGWVEASVHPWVKDIRPDNEEEDPGYGYQWWVLDDGEGDGPLVYSAMGYGGQYLLVVPELDLITVFTGWNIFGRPPTSIELFRDRILPAVATSPV